MQKHYRNTFLSLIIGIKILFYICFISACDGCRDDNQQMDESSDLSIKERELALKERKLDYEEKKMDAKERGLEEKENQKNTSPNPTNNNTSHTKKSTVELPPPPPGPGSSNTSNSTSNTNPSGDNNSEVVDNPPPQPEPQPQQNNNKKTPMQEAVDELSKLGERNTKKRRFTVQNVVEGLIKNNPDQFDPGKYDNQLLLCAIGNPPEKNPKWDINEVLKPVSSIIDILLQKNPGALKIKENKIANFLDGKKHKYDDIYWKLKEYAIA